MPDGVTDRAAEIWEPLLALADAAGAHWPITARAACEYFVLNTGSESASDGVRMLADLRVLFTLHGTDRLSTTQLIIELRAIDESPWGGDGDSRMLDARRLARELARFSVRPVPFKNSDGTATKGYVTFPNDRQVGLADAWDRYLPADTTPPADSGYLGYRGYSAGQAVTDETVVTDPSVTTALPLDAP